MHYFLIRKEDPSIPISPCLIGKRRVLLLTNESGKPVMLFYDINFQQVKSHGEDVAYFHAYWSRALKTELAKDFEILPAIKGKGRFLGMNMGIITDPLYQNSWWGEGEVKIYLDGDGDFQH